MSDALSTAAADFLGSLTAGQRVEAQGPFDVADRRVWTYLPGPRPGVTVEDLSEISRDRLDTLLNATLSAAGAERTRHVMELDGVLGVLEREQGQVGWERRGSGRYWARVLGDPQDAVWGWHLAGHHVGIFATVVDGELSAAPCFLGANPAIVPTGPSAGWQVLREEEWLARDLLAALDADQRRIAVVSPTAPFEIATRHDPVADPTVVPAGVRHADLDSAQRRQLEGLVRWYLGRVREDVAASAWRTAVDEGLGDLTFAWAGSDVPGEAHYYAIRGSSFLIEYDNAQTAANHVHTVWRDLRHDWGEDLLARHHALAHR